MHEPLFGADFGPYFFENEAGNAVTVNGVRYRSNLWPQLDSIMDMEDMWFQQDGATCHTVRETTELLHEKFPGCVSSHAIAIRIGHQGRAI
jgi:hypothetical protein